LAADEPCGLFKSLLSIGVDKFFECGFGNGRREYSMANLNGMASLDELIDLDWFLLLGFLHYNMDKQESIVS
jgi:hypothetical protein